MEAQQRFGVQAVLVVVVLLTTIVFLAHCLSARLSRSNLARDLAREKAWRGLQLRPESLLPNKHQTCAAAEALH